MSLADFHDSLRNDELLRIGAQRRRPLLNRVRHPACDEHAVCPARPQAVRAPALTSGTCMLPGSFPVWSILMRDGVSFVPGLARRVCAAHRPERRQRVAAALTAPRSIRART